MHAQRFFLHGTVPPGTKFSTNREMGNDFAEVTGVPTQAGQFTFAVSVTSTILEDKREREIATDDEFPGDSSIDPRDEGMYSIIIRE